MTHHALPDDADPAEDELVVRRVRHWLTHAVIGLNLCPFARAPMAQHRVRFRVSHARTEAALLIDLREELTALQASEPQSCETTLLIHPKVLGDFFDYNQFLTRADDQLVELGLEGELQIASFHPDYRFADTPGDAIENFTNRSPYPILHLLRESSISFAVDSLPNPDVIFQRNIATLRNLGPEGWQALVHEDAGPDIDR